MAKKVIPLEKAKKDIKPTLKKKVMGQPMKFKCLADFQVLVNEYFEITPKEEWTITGLVLSMKINKDTFYEYAKRDEFKEFIAEARLKVENAYELSLRKNGRTGDIFALKNFGWVDSIKQEIVTPPIIQDDL